MADETKDAVEAAVETAQAATEAAGKTAKQATDTTERASKRVTTAAATAAKKNAGRVKAPRRTRRVARKPGAAAANERINDVNADTNNWFAAFGALPTAAPFQTLFAEAGERGQEAVRRSQKAAEELADLSRANVEALVEAGRIAAEGARTIGQDVVESSREGIEQAADAVRSLAEAKSATEFVQLQSEFARKSFDRIVAESSRLTESFVKLAGEAVQPISTRASLNAERINQFVA